MSLIKSDNSKLLYLEDQLCTKARALSIIVCDSTRITLNSKYVFRIFDDEGTSAPNSERSAVDQGPAQENCKPMITVLSCERSAVTNDNG